MTALPVCDHDECKSSDFCNHWTVEQAFRHGMLEGQRRTYAQAFAAGVQQGMTQSAEIARKVECGANTWMSVGTEKSRLAIIDARDAKIKSQ